MSIIILKILWTDFYLGGIIGLLVVVGYFLLNQGLKKIKK